MDEHAASWHGEGKGVVLLSGGLDSTLVAKMAVQELGRKNVTALTLYYGQKHEIELEAASDVAEFLGIEHIIRELPPIFGGTTSTLVQGGPKNPEGSYASIAESKGVSPTYVPFRNGNLLSAATAVALGLEASWLYYGAHAEDARNWAYPDCTPEFNGAMANAIYVGSYGKVRLITPLQNLEKWEIAQKSFEYGSPMHLTYSCYNGREQHCGTCPTCVARIQAFAKAGMTDPVRYEIPIDWGKLIEDFKY